MAVIKLDYFRFNSKLYMDVHINVFWNVDYYTSRPYWAVSYFGTVHREQNTGNNKVPKAVVVEIWTEDYGVTKESITFHLCYYGAINQCVEELVKGAAKKNMSYLNMDKLIEENHTPTRVLPAQGGACT